MPDDARDHIELLMYSLREHKDEIQRLHPEVSNVATVELLRRQLITIIEAYLELLELYVQEVNERGGRS